MQRKFLLLALAGVIAWRVHPTATADPDLASRVAELSLTQQEQSGSRTMPDFEQGPPDSDYVRFKRLRARIRELEALDDESCAKIDALNAENARLRARLDEEPNDA